LQKKKKPLPDPDKGEEKKLAVDAGFFI